MLFSQGLLANYFPGVSMQAQFERKEMSLFPGEANSYFL